jgi:hypothetical protein
MQAVEHVSCTEQRRFLVLDRLCSKLVHLWGDTLEVTYPLAHLAIHEPVRALVR